VLLSRTTIIGDGDDVIVANFESTPLAAGASYTRTRMRQRLSRNLDGHLLRFPAAPTRENSVLEFRGSPEAADEQRLDAAAVRPRRATAEPPGGMSSSPCTTEPAIGNVRPLAGTRPTAETSRAGAYNDARASYATHHRRASSSSTSFAVSSSRRAGWTSRSYSFTLADGNAARASRRSPSRPTRRTRCPETNETTTVRPPPRPLTLAPYAGSSSRRR